MAFVKIFKEKNLASLYAPNDIEGWVRDDDSAKHNHLRLVTYIMIACLISAFLSVLLLFPEALSRQVRQFNEAWPTYAIPIAVIIYVLLHEFIHVVAMPLSKDGLGQSYCIFSNGMPAVFYNGEMSINRLVFVTLSPLIFISLILIPLWYLYDDVLVKFLFFNHLLSCTFDIKLAIRLLRKYGQFKYIYSSREGILFR